VLSLHEVPELGFGKHWVCCEDAHSVEGRVGNAVCGVLSANNPILLQLYEKSIRVMHIGQKGIKLLSFTLIQLLFL